MEWAEVFERARRLGAASLGLQVVVSLLEVVLPAFSAPVCELPRPTEPEAPECEPTETEAPVCEPAETEAEEFESQDPSTSPQALL